MIPRIALTFLLLLPGLASGQITMVSVSAPSPASSNVSAITVPQPAGLQAGDVMLASLAWRGGSGISVSSVPAGWTEVVSGVDASRQAMRVYVKVAGASEPASYGWSLSGSDRAAGSIIAFRGVDNASPVAASAIQANAASTSITAPAVAPSSADTLLAGFFSMARGGESVSPPAGMTEAFDIGTGAGINGITLAAAYAAHAPSGDTGIRVATGSSAQASIGALVALRRAALVGGFVNGGFELATVNPGSFNTMTTGDTRVTGWTVIGGDINYIGTYWTSSEGNRSLDLVGERGRGGVAQTFATTPGATYDVLFDLAGNANAQPVVKPLTVSAAGTTRSYAFDTTGRSNRAMGWTTQIFTFTATSTSTTLSFLSDTGSNCCAGAALDNVRVTERTSGGGGGSAGSFNAFDSSTASGATTAPIQTKVAGSAFSLSVVALNTARTAVDSGFTGSVTVQLLDARDSSGALDSNGCRSSWVSIPGASASISFSPGNAGRLDATLSEANAWPDVRVRMTAGTARSGCSTDNFAIRPAAILVNAIDLDWQTPFAGTGSPRALSNGSASGGIVHAAGRPFTLSAIAVNSSGAAITNYRGSPSLRAGGLGCALPAGCSPGGFAFSSWSAAGNGEVRAIDATYSEVGTFTLQLEDAAFAAVDAADTPDVQRVVAQSGGAITVGRFVPAWYDLQPSGAAPALRTMNATDASCSAPPPGTPRRSFTYVGQPFGFATRPQATILARNAAGQLTGNYRGTLWKLGPQQILRAIDASSTAPAGRPVSVSLGALDPADVVSNGDGSGTVTASAQDAITYTRSPTTPQSPFTAAITAQIQVIDATEAGVAGNPAVIGTTAIACFNGGGTCTAPGPGIAFDSATGAFPGNEFRYGRLRLANANGSELIALPVPMFAEYWSGSAWVANTRDHCTTISTPNLALSNYQRNLSAGETTPAIAGPLSSGSRSILFSPPGAGNAGSVDLAINLAAGAANLPWLQGAWTANTFDQNPAARATFGTFAAPSPIIFRRERF